MTKHLRQLNKLQIMILNFFPRIQVFFRFALKFPENIVIVLQFFLVHPSSDSLNSKISL